MVIENGEVQCLIDMVLYNGYFYIEILHEILHK